MDHTPDSKRICEGPRMKDQNKTKKQLIEELEVLRNQLVEPKKGETKRKPVKEALRESEETFRALAENANDGIFVAMGEGVHAYANKRAGEITGYSVAELLKSNIKDLVHPDELKRIMERYRKRLAGEPVPLQYETVIIRKDRKSLPIELTGAKTTWHGQPANLVMIRDITERKQAEDALREKQETINAVIETSQDWIWAIDHQGVHTYSNPAIERILGYGTEEIVGRSSLDLIHEDDKKMVESILRECEEKRCGWNNLLLRWRHKNGTYRYLESNAVPILNSKGDLVGFRGVDRDITERKRAEEALHESEERMKSIFRAAPIGIGVVTNRVLMDVNARICEMTGYSREELVGSSARIVYPTQDDFDYVGTEKYRQIAEKGTGSVETRWMKKDGTIIDVLLSSSPIDPSDLSRGVTFTALDITECKRAENALKESEDQYRHLVENSPVIVWSFSDKRGTLFASSRVKSILGYSPDFLYENPWLWNKSIHPDNQYSVAQSIKDFASGKDLSVEYRIKDSSGNWRWFHDRSIGKHREGEATIIEGISIDITERKRAESALRESEERYRTLVETSPDAISLLDLNLNIVMVNRPALALYGYESLEEVIGRSALNFIAPEDRPRALEEARQMLETGSIATSEYTQLRKGDIPFPAELRASLILDGEKRPFAIICVTRDISGRKREEEEKAALEDQLRQSQKMEAIGQLAGGVAHDFNNLLTVIKGYCQLSLVEIKEGTPLREAFEVINKAAEKAADLTRQLLAFSRRQIMEVRVLDLNGLLQNLDKMLRRIIGEDIELITLLGEDLGRVKADPGQIEQAVMNLAVNAKDAMSKGGKLIIETANVELDEAYANAHVAVTPGPYVMIAVSDTGTGMAQEVRDRVFEPFFTTKGKGKGTGLGLSTVYGIVKQSNGNIWVYSEPGEGTTFKIFLPRVDEPAEKLKAQEAGEEFPGGSETILIVEDDKEVRNLTVRILKRQGYTVLDGSYGDEAFNVCRQHKGPIHLLVTDVVMPGMDGRALSECLSQLHPEMKVLYMSGYTDDAIVHHGVMGKGMNYIQKPFTVNGLTKKVREVLDQSRQH
jgi:two-component system cell cycle sensor histidine kinase/response regulator CckA